MALVPMEYEANQAAYPTITCTSGNATTNNAEMVRVGSTVQMKFDVTASQNISIGSDMVFTSNITWLPKTLTLMAGFSGNTLVVGRMNTSGVITLRALASQFVKDYTATIEATWATDT